MSNITGNIILGLQALDKNNAVIFNRNVPGLQVNCNSAEIINGFLCPLSAKSLDIPLTFYGIYIKNPDATAILTLIITYVTDTLTFALQPGSVFLWFNSLPLHMLSATIQSTVQNSLAEVAFWA